VTKQRKGDLLAVFDEMARLHPTEPHWYLPLIGVKPRQQGQGLGAALLRPILEKCDAMHLPAYLEATSSRSLPLYRRHGFKAIGEIKVRDCPPIIPMLRLPASGMTSRHSATERRQPVVESRAIVPARAAQHPSANQIVAFAKSVGCSAPANATPLAVRRRSTDLQTLAGT